MPDGKRKGHKRSDQIVEAALRVFGEKGYHNTTVSEIAKAAGISETTLYKYFTDKEDILFSIPSKLILEWNEFMYRALLFIKGAENRIRAIIYAYYLIYKENPAYSALVLQNLRNSERFMNTESYELTRQAARKLLETIKEGISSGEFRQDVDPYLVRHILLGTIEHVFQRWHLLNRSYELPDFIDPLLEIVFSGIRNDGSKHPASRVAPRTEKPGVGREA
jgi:TetR/AcrR family fatty acid metabolism transcriptional regulator